MKTNTKSYMAAGIALAGAGAIAMAPAAHEVQARGARHRQ
jgi:hypothetical protein